MNIRHLVLFLIVISSSLSRAQQNLVDAVKQGISEGEQENAAMQKLQAIKKKSTWKGDGWFYNIAKEQENRFLIQKVIIIPKKGLTDVPEIATLSIHVDGSGAITDQKIDEFIFSLNASMGSYLDKGIISRDRGGLLGAAVGSVPEGCSGGFVPISLCEDVASNVFPKFYEWEKIAQEKNVAPFIKYFDGRKFYETWDDKRGMTNKVEAHGGGEVIDRKKYNAFKNMMLDKFDKDVKTSLEGGGFAPTTEIQEATEKVRYNPGNQKYVDELNKAVSEARKGVEARAYNLAKDEGIIRDEPYVPAVTARDPSFEQTGWVFVWKGGKAYSFKIQGERDFEALYLLINGGDSEVALANLSGDSLLSKEVIDGFKIWYDFLQTVRKDASKYVSEYSATQSRQSYEQEALFK
jgi:hypothetical protein